MYKMSVRQALEKVTQQCILFILSINLKTEKDNKVYRLFPDLKADFDSVDKCLISYK